MTTVVQAGNGEDGNKSLWGRVRMEVKLGGDGYKICGGDRGWV